MRKGFDSLCGIVTSELKMNVLNGAVFIFMNKKHSQVKLLLWEGDGFAIYYKRLEKGTFELPLTANDDKDFSITKQNCCRTVGYPCQFISGSVEVVARRIFFYSHIHKI